MCTICGHFVAGSKKIPSTDIYDMLTKMEHRGPDTHGIYLDDHIFRVKDLEELNGTLLWKSRIALGHSRLSIVGADGRTQPYTSCDDRITLIHNGEIYNFRKLKSLLKRDHQWKTSSDSEVIVHLIEEAYEGDLLDAVRRVQWLLDGMYSLAVTDGKKVVAARDPIGKKPLYFIENEGVTYFASEKKALLNGKDEPRWVNPGHILTIDEEGARVVEGYHIQMPQIDITEFDEAVSRYKRTITRAIKKRLVGLREGTIGVIFSGGIDSVLIAKLLLNEGQNVVCYCTGTKDSGDIKAARTVADDLGLELKTTIIDEEMVESVLPRIIEEVEESGLLQVEVAIPMYMAARMAAEDGIRVMFTGQAADEIWAGYPWYSDVIEEHGYLKLHEKLWEDLNRLYTDTLEREDKLTMAHAIELRAPYLDRDVIQLAMRVSPRLKIRGSADKLRKRVHRQASVELGVPAYLCNRVKDPAQSGSGIHDIIQKIADSSGKQADVELVRENIRRDKGSCFRYGRREGEYGSKQARAYLQAIEDKVRSRYIPRFLAAGRDL